MSPGPISPDSSQIEPICHLDEKDYLERYELEKKRRFDEINEFLSQYKVKKAAIEEKISLSEMVKNGGGLKEALSKELKVLKDERDQQVIDYKMIEKQHRHALNIFRNNFSSPKTKKNKVRVEFTSSSCRGPKEDEAKSQLPNSVI